jgi:hypothetical protein
LFAIDPPEIQFSIPVLSSPARVEPLRHCRRTDIVTLSLDAAEGQKSQEGAWSLMVRGLALEKTCSSTPLFNYGDPAEQDEASQSAG